MSIKDLRASAAGIAIVALLPLVYFPGGTIFMALMCDSRRLDGWDWILSVIVPGYGLIAGLLC